MASNYQNRDSDKSSSTEEVLKLNDNNIITNIPTDDLPGNRIYVPPEFQGYQFLPLDYVAFDGILGELVKDVAPYMQVHPFAIMQCLIAYFMTAVGKAPYIDFGFDKKHYLFFEKLMKIKENEVSKNIFCNFDFFHCIS